jgi:hypothetical protein
LSTNKEKEFLMQEQINLNEIDDLQKLQAMRGEEFVKRENAQQLIAVTDQNIQALTTRISQVVAAEAATDTPPAPAPAPGSVTEPDNPPAPQD